jgi:hypothetical protein
MSQMHTLSTHHAIHTTHAHQHIGTTSRYPRRTHTHSHTAQYCTRHTDPLRQPRLLCSAKRRQKGLQRTRGKGVCCVVWIGATVRGGPCVVLAPDRVGFCCRWFKGQYCIKGLPPWARVAWALSPPNSSCRAGSSSAARRRVAVRMCFLCVLRIFPTLSITSSSLSSSCSHPLLSSLSTL